MEQLRDGRFETVGPEGETLVPLPTPEAKTPALASAYALSKYDQEQLCLMVGRSCSIPTVALRLFNVYGPRQRVSNPYTGVLAIFAAGLLNGARPLVFEDGHQRRDFVSVHDVAKAFVLALEGSAAVGLALNIGSGENRSVTEVAASMAEAMGKPHLEAEITGKYRVGDIRHCFADIALARRVLGYWPRMTFDEGLCELCGWLAGERADDRSAEARAELAATGLTI